MFDSLIIVRAIFCIAVGHLFWILLRVNLRSFQHYLFWYMLGSGSLLLLSLGTLWVGDTRDLLPTENVAVILEWLRITGVTFFLTGLALMIRSSKPKIAQAPVILSLLPLALLAAHPFVMHTLVLKDVLINIYVSGGLVISLLIYSLKVYQNHIYTHILAGMSLAGIMFIISKTNVVNLDYAEVLVYSGYSVASYIVGKGIRKTEIHEMLTQSNTQS